MTQSNRIIVWWAIGITVGIILIGWLFVFDIKIPPFRIERPTDLQPIVRRSSESETFLPFRIERLDGTVVTGQGYINLDIGCDLSGSVHCPAPYYIILDQASVELLRTRNLFPPPEIKFNGRIAVFKSDQSWLFSSRQTPGFQSYRIRGQYTPLLNPECSGIPRISDSLPPTSLGCLSGMYIGPALLIDEINELKK